MGKNVKKDNAKTKKDIVQTKSGSGSITKAKDKRKKPAALKKIKEKIDKEIESANSEFAELQSKMVCEKENKKIESLECDLKEILNPAEVSKVPLPQTVSQEKQVEETTNVLANL